MFNVPYFVLIINEIGESIENYFSFVRTYSAINLFWLLYRWMDRGYFFKSDIPSIFMSLILCLSLFQENTQRFHVFLGFQFRINSHFSANLELVLIKNVFLGQRHQSVSPPKVIVSSQRELLRLLDFHNKCQNCCLSKL